MYLPVCAVVLAFSTVLGEDCLMELSLCLLLSDLNQIRSITLTPHFVTSRISTSISVMHQLVQGRGFGLGYRIALDLPKHACTVRTTT